MRKVIGALFSLFLFLVVVPCSTMAQESSSSRPEETLETIVVGINQEQEIIFPESNIRQLQQELKLKVTKGSLLGNEIVVESGNLPAANLPKYKMGDQLLVSYGKDFEGSDSFYITDYIRRDALLYLFLIFIVLTLFIAKWQGLSSIFGMGISFLVIFMFILPKISTGSNPILIAIIGSLVIIPITFYLSHGLNKKTTVAVVGTLVSLVITGFIAAFFIEATKLTGFSSDEAGFLQVAKHGTINLKGLILAGIIVGALGILDDITISQAAIVDELHKTDKRLKSTQLYKRAMNVGKDHISSLVNTLILVYAGAALPLLLLFTDSSRSFSEVINYEMIAEEIVRTLVASIGLIIAVPITTFIAVFVAKEFERNSSN